ncbi:MAG: protein kinase [Deltaproteobacteria bacterium]|nr:protein kinase [Deltaproteobacteria bacterium]
MASVYVGRLSGMAGFERLVAIKVIHPHLASEESFVKMFLDEARLAAGIHHPNVGEILEVGEEDGLFFMVGELILGQNLRNLYRQAQYTKQEISHVIWARIASQVCLGLHAAHELKEPDGRELDLVHRDVSPRNILVSYDGFVKLIDFGVALARGRMSHTDAGTVKGKIGYMPPEQIKGLPMDRRSDLFPLGITLYQMITGHHPFPGDSEAERMQKVLKGAYAWPGLLIDDLNPMLEKIILTAMANSPDERYPTAMDMHDHIEEYIRSVGVDVGNSALSKLMHSFFEEEHAQHTKKLRAHREQGTGQIVTRQAPEVQETEDEDKTEAATPMALQEEDRRTKRQRSRFVPIAVAAAVLVIATIAVAFLFGLKDGPVSPPATPVSTAAAEVELTKPNSAVEKEAAEEIQISFSVHPEGAQIKVDGQDLEPGATHYKLLADGTNHDVEISAEGYEPYKEIIVADVNRAVSVKLAETKKRTNKKPRKIKKKKKSKLKGSPYR